MLMRRLVRSLAALVVLTGGLTAGSAGLLSGPAGAAACGPTAPTSGDCEMTGSVALTGGTLTLASPASLSWAGTLTGSDQSLVDTVPADQQYTVGDATGTGAGWHVTISATTFTNGGSTFPDAGTFVTNGSTSDITATTGPSATCSTTCTPPANTTTYPVAISPAAVTPTASTIYYASANTGLGSIVIGGSTAANPVGWWVNVPGNAIAGAYTSSMTMAVISGP